MISGSPKVLIPSNKENIVIKAMNWGIVKSDFVVFSSWQERI